MTKTVGLVLLLLMPGPLTAQQPPKLTPLMSRELAESPGKEVLMITVEYEPGARTPSTATMPMGSYTSWRAPW